MADGQIPIGPADLAGKAFELELFAIDKLTDPALNTALGPQSGLQVTPAIFQSIEPEGRWKQASLLNLTGDDTSKGRVFELAGHAQDMATQPPPPVKFSDPWGEVIRHNIPLFTLDVLSFNSTALGVMALNLLSPGMPAAAINSLAAAAGQSQVLARSVLTVDATWWSDGLEIYAGWAGMQKASGFDSAFNSTANVALQAIPFGNYFPTSVLVTWSGWVNPIGPGYYEFRGGVVLNADGSNSAAANSAGSVPGVQQQSWQQSPDGPPAFMTYWTRDPNQQPQSTGPWDKNKGFVLLPPEPQPKPQPASKPKPATSTAAPATSTTVAQQAVSAVLALLNVLNGQAPGAPSITPFPGGP